MNKLTKILLIFFAVTFAWTWAFYIPIAAGSHNPDRAISLLVDEP